MMVFDGNSCRMTEICKGKLKLPDDFDSLLTADRHMSETFTVATQFDGESLP